MPKDIVCHTKPTGVRPVPLRLHDPMYSNQPVEVMLRTTEKVQNFLMTHLDGDCELRDVNIISYDMIKISKCGGIYTKAIERC